MPAAPATGASLPARASPRSHAPARASRAALAAQHATIHDDASATALSTAYHALLTAALASWAPPHALAPPAFVACVRAVLQSLPSSSAAPGLAAGAPDVQAFSDIFVDLAWTVDLELDELILEAKTALPTTEQTGAVAPAASQSQDATAAKAEQAKLNAEKDKETLASIMRSLLVRVSSPSMRNTPPTLHWITGRKRTGLQYVPAAA
jgi:THO complex subunit 2